MPSRLCPPLSPPLPHAGSPIGGLISVRGSLGGSWSEPTGSLHMRLADGAIGNTRLARAAAQATITPSQALTVNVELAPADAGGSLRLAGTVALPSISAAPAPPPAAGAGPVAAAPAGAAEDAVDLLLSISDGGMALVSSLVPSLRWESGGAAVSMRLAGPVSGPQLTGSCSLSRAVLHSTSLRYPLTHLSGRVEADGRRLAVTAPLEARVGSKGHVRVTGALPLQPPTAAGGADAAGSGVCIEVTGLELRVRNLYAGALDADLVLAGSVAAPVLGGRLQLSRGTAYLIPQGASPAAAAAAAAAEAAATAGSGGSDAELVERAFGALRAGRLRAAAASAVQVGGGGEGGSPGGAGPGAGPPGAAGR